MHGEHRWRGGHWPSSWAQGCWSPSWVGSGIMATPPSPHDVGPELPENAAATTAGLTVPIAVFGPVSGAHFNSVLSIANWVLGRRTRSSLHDQDLLVNLPA